MSSSLPSEALTLPVPRLGIRNALLKSSKIVNEEHLLVNEQQQSILIQLPRDIRKLIWQYVLGGKRVEFKLEQWIRAKRFARCTWGYAYGCEWRTMIQTDDGPCSSMWRPNLRHVTSLLKTCRLV